MKNFISVLIVFITNIIYCFSEGAQQSMNFAIDMQRSWLTQMLYENEMRARLAARQAIIETRNSQITTVILGLLLIGLGVLLCKNKAKAICIVGSISIIIICLILEMSILSVKY